MVQETLVQDGTTSSNHRAAQAKYWKEHSATATVEAMMLDSQAKIIDKQERPEVLGMLGSVAGKRVVELGAGIGRFTGELARNAAHVLAVDFMENLIAQNREDNAHCSNVEWRQADATQLALPVNSFDVVFSNWLLMYLDNEEVAKLAADSLRWVKEGGTIFFRESCFRQSGDAKRSNNPTHYRNPRNYFAIFDSAEIEEADGRFAHYELVSCKCVDTYVRVKKNQNQICWKWVKVVTEGRRPGTVRSFLDSTQYSTASILRYERIFGSGFVSTGGIETTKEFVAKLALQPGERVLDVGCGIGGGDFYMAAQHSVYVHGIDLSVNMVLIGLERAQQQNQTQVSFEIADCTTAEFQPESYDVIYSRDTLLHIYEKPALFKRFMEMLRPGGRLLISDYCRKAGAVSRGFEKYIKARGYDLHSVEDYGVMLKDAGFADVVAEDRTWQFEASLQRELAAAKAEKAAFVAEFSEEDYSEVVGGWAAKLERVAEGEQRWGLFTARKPE
jgi:phosphoethanolamine N-methyltransferase